MMIGTGGKAPHTIEAWDPSVYRDGTSWSKVTAGARAFHMAQRKEKPQLVHWDRLNTYRQLQFVENHIRHAYTDYERFIALLLEMHPFDGRLYVPRVIDRITPLIHDAFPELLQDGHLGKVARSW